MPDQYPTKKNQETLVNLCSSIAKKGFDDDGDSTDDEALTSHIYMAKTSRPNSTETADSSDESDGKQEWNPNKVYAIADGGADSCIVGKYAKVLSYTGHFASLYGYDPETTNKKNFPIVTALMKARSSSTDGHPILLKIPEAIYNSQSPITLLSEYQIREHGLVIDSIAKKHMSAHGKRGTQRFQVNPWVHIDLEDREGLMGFEILPFENGDEDKYDIITITSPKRWYPNKFQSNDASPNPASPNNTTSLLTSMTYEKGKLSRIMKGESILERFKKGEQVHATGEQVTKKEKPIFDPTPANETTKKGEDSMSSESPSQFHNSKFESSISKKPSLKIPFDRHGMNKGQFHALRNQELAMSKKDPSLDKEKQQGCDHHKIKDIITEGFKLFRHNLDEDKKLHITKKKGRVLFKKKTENCQVPKKKKKCYVRQLYAIITGRGENT